jgi:hypothetical protein
MPLPAIRQRVSRLEAVFVVDRLADFPPLTTEEIEALVERMAGGEKWTREETARVGVMLWWRLVQLCGYSAIHIRVLLYSKTIIMNYSGELRQNIVESVLVDHGLFD